MNSGSSWAHRAAAELPDRDDDPESPDSRPTRGAVLSDPEGAEAELVIDEPCAACAAARLRAEEGQRAAYDRAMGEQWAIAAARLRTHCNWCDTPVTPDPSASPLLCEACKGWDGPDAAAEAAQDGEPFDSDMIPW
jgi:hypothetical protein